MIKHLLALVLLIFLTACSGNHQENVAKLDKIYGKCDNPMTKNTMSDRDRKICQEKVRAAGPDGEVGEPKTFTDIINDLVGERIGAGGYANQGVVNSYLWQGSLKTLNSYALKNVDANGGYIETEWIIDQQSNQRCAIKAQIISSDFISNGVEVKIICQDKLNDDWVNVSEDFSEEEKKITLTILENARAYSLSNPS